MQYRPGETWYDGHGNSIFIGAWSDSTNLACTVTFNCLAMKPISENVLMTQSRIKLEGFVYRSIDATIVASTQSKEPSRMWYELYDILKHAEDK